MPTKKELRELQRLPVGRTMMTGAGEVRALNIKDIKDAVYICKPCAFYRAKAKEPHPYCIFACTARYRADRTSVHFLPADAPYLLNRAKK